MIAPLEPPADGLTLLRQRCSRVPAALASLLRQAPSWPALPARLTLATGIGGSEGPARLLASLRLRLGLPARFVPLSSFLGPPPPAEALVLFSQGLCPNASLVLAHAHRYGDRRLLTSLPPQHPALASQRGLAVQTLPCEDEAGLLVRVVGPALSSLAAVLMTEAPPWPSPDALSEALELAAARARQLAPLGPACVGLVSAGAAVEAHEGARWRLLEGLLRPDVQLWDVLALAHGPFQALYESPATLLALEAPDTLPAALVDRLASMLRPERHRLLRLVARLPFPWSIFEHLVQLDALMLASLEAAPRPLSPWPGQGEDGPLYRLTAPASPPPPPLQLRGEGEPEGENTPLGSPSSPPLHGAGEGAGG